MTTHDLTGKTAVISGVSRGLGAAIAEEFLAAGASVAGFSRNPSPDVERLAAEWKSFHFATADMLDRDSLRAKITPGDVGDVEFPWTARWTYAWSLLPVPA